MSLEILPGSPQTRSAFWTMVRDVRFQMQPAARCRHAQHTQHTHSTHNTHTAHSTCHVTPSDAAKTGSTWKQTSDGRRVLFAFTGWQAPTAPAGSGRALIVPREVTIDNTTNDLVVAPVVEVAQLRVASSHVAIPAATDGAKIIDGSQVQIQLQCTLPTTPPASGRVGVRVLSSGDGAAYFEVGLDFATMSLYANHSVCCTSPNTIVQRAPFDADKLAKRGLHLNLLVDGGLVESFLSGVALTSWLAPDAAQGQPSARISTFTSSVSGATCNVDAWHMDYQA